jgi:hypothetical protein
MKSLSEDFSTLHGPRSQAELHEGALVTPLGFVDRWGKRRAEVARASARVPCEAKAVSAVIRAAQTITRLEMPIKLIACFLVWTVTLLTLTPAKTVAQVQTNQAPDQNLQNLFEPLSRRKPDLKVTFAKEVSRIKAGTLTTADFDRMQQTNQTPKDIPGTLYRDYGRHSRGRDQTPVQRKETRRL